MCYYIISGMIICRCLYYIYRYRNKSRFNESKVKYIFARKLKIQYAWCTFTDKRNELIKFIYILLFPARWIGAKNNNNKKQRYHRNRKWRIDTTIFSRKCLPIWMDENKKNIRKFANFNLSFEKINESLFDIDILY